MQDANEGGPALPAVLPRHPPVDHWVVCGPKTIVNGLELVCITVTNIDAHLQLPLPTVGPFQLFCDQ